MNIIDRAKNILLTPKTEWVTIANEPATLSSLLTSYVLVLAAIPAVASVVGATVLGMGVGSRFVIVSALIAYIMAVASYVITAYVADMLASTFKSEKNLDKSAQLVAYSATASWVASVLSIIPFIGWIGSIAGGIYAIYLLYLGVGPVKKTPEDQRIIYVVVIIVVLVVASLVLGSVLGMLLLTGGALSAR
ncbi:MAG: YIP1 family protein [Bacteroidetes bacterium]|nr:YIP1 family protein [Bacteroidota bacterium]MBS1540973.1 YIP1 family protein [Bacteroidota bacterium]